MKKSFITIWAFVLPILLFSSLQLSAQRTCGAMGHMHAEEQADPHITQIRQQIEARTQAYINNTDENSRVDGIITIPVVVHVIYNGNTENISDAQVQSQIDVLNDDFRRLNSDADGTWSQAADTEIEFCMATSDPTGAATNGITRTSTNVSAFGTNDEMKFNSSGGKDAWPASDYLNMWVCDISGGILGYAQFPGGADATDGVVMDYQYFGTIGTATSPFDLGRTATHEVGHWLNLRHIWGDGGCSVDDFVADTPASDAANYGCADTHISCNSLDMVQNYMDYSDDACMNLFTEGQKTRMRALFDAGGAKVSLLSSSACGPLPDPTCDDGIQNQDETGVDCGGASCDACPTCDDGIQNQDETGVDCGGASCNVCPCTGGTSVVLSILFDSWPEEISWTLVDGSGTTIDSEAYTNNVLANQTDTRTYCLPDDCYVFTINDSYGDGLFDSQNTGNYTLVDDAGNTLGTDSGNFGDSSTASFCVPVPSCTDGIMNGDETGVDCGGPDCPVCPTVTGVYVDLSATGDNDGSDWTNAFTDLQDALAIGANETIHIAEGIYLPTSGTQRGASFSIPSGAEVLGGYPAGGGTRDADTYTTTLSGEIDGVNGFAGNSYHVVKLQNVTGVVLDGLDIKDGSADDASSFGRARGGGIYSVGSSAMINNTTIRRNKAVYGGGMFATTSTLVLDNCEIKLNTAGNGAAIYHSNMTDLMLNSCLITDNNSTTRCAIEINNSSSTEINNTIIANNASGNANAIGFIATNRDQTCNIYNSTIVGETKNKALITLQVGFGDQLDVNIYNSIIAHQTASFDKTVAAFSNGTLNFNTTNCYVQGSTITGNATANIYEDVVGAVTYGVNYAPDSCSPTVDAGNNANTNSLTTDFDGGARIVAGTVDIGAHEAKNPCSVTRESFNDNVNIFPNPTTGMVFIKTDLETFNVEVFDILGKVVAQSNTNEINLTQLPLGIYMVNVESNGTIVKTEKIIKK